jgi:tRNA-2-methylthio-N6-dimethylallyladenosine synthase
VRFDNLFSFQYSEREGTTAAGMDGQVKCSVKRERLRVLQSLQATHTLEKNRDSAGRVETVLVEGLSKNAKKDMTGRTRGNRIVNFPGGPELIGQKVSVRITETFLHSLRGRIEDRGGADVH